MSHSRGSGRWNAFFFGGDGGCGPGGGGGGLALLLDNGESGINWANGVRLSAVRNETPWEPVWRYVAQDMCVVRADQLVRISGRVAGGGGLPRSRYLQVRLAVAWAVVLAPGPLPIVALRVNLSTSRRVFPRP